MYVFFVSQLGYVAQAKNLKSRCNPALPLFLLLKGPEHVRHVKRGTPDQIHEIDRIYPIIMLEHDVSVLEIRQPLCRLDLRWLLLQPYYS